ncbi:hypothetical protein [Streptomyces sp. NPDC059452]|uniref:hypothetical protein n=1 Tax=Streptomyces sp. NPDC059452 TaxID=3346835 RepID=UPI0036CBD56A
MRIPTFLIIIPFLLSAVLFAAAEYRDRKAVNAGAPKAEKGLLPIRWVSVAVIVLASVAGTALGGYVGDGFHVVAFVVSPCWSFLPLFAVTRFLGRVPGTAAVLALGLSAGVFSFLFAVSLKAVSLE